MPLNELEEISKAAREAARDFMIGDTNGERELTAALINYQGSQLIAEQLARIHEKLDSINENIWRGKS